MALPSSGRALADGTFPRPFFAPVTLLWRGGSEPGLLGLLAQDAIEEVAAQEAPAACLSLLLGQHSLPRPRQVLHGHDANVTGLSFGASGTLASTGQDMMVSIFATDKQQQDTLTSRHRSDSTQGYTQPPELRLPVGSSSSAPVMASCVAHSPCNTYLAVGTAQGFVEVWTLPSHGAGNAPTPPSPQGSKDAESQMHLFTDLQGHFGCVTAVAWSASGQLLASGGADGKVHIWHVASHTLLGTLERHKDMVNSVAFNPTHETVLLSCSEDNSVRVWDVQLLLDAASARLHKPAAPSAAPTSSMGSPVPATPALSTAASPALYPAAHHDSRDSAALLLGALPPGMDEAKPTPHGDDTLGSGFGPGFGARFGGGHGANLSSVSSRLARSRAGPSPSLRSLCKWSALPAHSSVRAPEPDAGVLACPTSVAFHPNGQQFAVACAGGVWLWGHGVPEGTSACCSSTQAKGHWLPCAQEARAVAYSPCGRWLAVTLWDALAAHAGVALLATQGFRVRSVLQGPAGVDATLMQVVPVAFSADSRLLAASLVSASVYVWAVDALPYVEDFAF